MTATACADVQLLDPRGPGREERGAGFRHRRCPHVGATGQRGIRGQPVAVSVQPRTGGRVEDEPRVQRDVIAGAVHPNWNFAFGLLALPAVTPSH